MGAARWVARTSWKVRAAAPVTFRPSMADVLVLLTMVAGNTLSTTLSKSSKKLETLPAPKLVPSMRRFKPKFDSTLIEAMKTALVDFIDSFGSLAFVVSASSLLSLLCYDLSDRRAPFHVRHLCHGRGRVSTRQEKRVELYGKVQ